jgi:hypothetical protein
MKMELTVVLDFHLVLLVRLLQEAVVVVEQQTAEVAEQQEQVELVAAETQQRVTDQHSLELQILAEVAAGLDMEVILVFQVAVALG